MTNDFANTASVATAERLSGASSLHGAELAQQAAKTAGSMRWVPGKSSSDYSERLKKLRSTLPKALAKDAEGKIRLAEEEQRWLRENRAMLRSELALLEGSVPGMHLVEQVRTASGMLLPRVLMLTEDFLVSVGYRFRDDDLAEYVRGFQTVVVLRMAELWEIVPAMRFVLLERVVEVIENSDNSASPNTTAVSDCIRSLFAIQQAPWPDTGADGRVRCGASAGPGGRVSQDGH